MAALEDWSDAQLRRLYREVMEKGDPFAESPHAHKPQEDLVIEMDSADEVMGEMSAEIGRLTLNRGVWKVLAIVGWIVVALLWIARRP